MCVNLKQRICVKFERCLNAIALHEKPISKLRSVTCHARSHSVNCHPTQANVPVLDLPTPEGWKAELTLAWVLY